MKKFAISLIIFTFLFLAYDKLFIPVAGLSADAEIDKRLEYLIKGEINKDIVIIGSSTGSRDIIAGQIEDSTGLSVYNLCYPGSNVEFHEFIFRTLITFNKPPRLLLLVVDDDKELLYDETTTFRNDRLYPLVKYYYIRQELINRGEKDKFFSKFLVLHQLNKANFDLRKKRFTPLDTILDCGSMPISGQRKGREWKYDSDEKIYNMENELPPKVTAFKEIIETCYDLNIEILIIFPPLYKIPDMSFVSRIKELSGSGAYFYIYNTDDPVYKDKSYFYDESHLIRKAAVKLTNEIIFCLDSLSKDNLNLIKD
jgi:hypothetical protein